MQDMFGNMLSVGDHILYAEWQLDVDKNEVPCLCLYRLTEVSPGEIKGELLDGTGNWFYIESPDQRVVRIGDNRSMYDVAGYYRDSTIH